MDDPQSLPFTGERFVPGARGEIWIEHWHRYHFAAQRVAGRRVLDVACGEGYGSALLARHAAHVIGVDVSQAAIEHARRSYASLPNLEFVRASCTQLPLPDASVDVAVSFETIEHIAEQERFLDELARVAKPDGIVILSCPNKLEYSDKRDYANEFHVRELYRDELAAMVQARLPQVQWHGQRPSFYSVIAPESLDTLGRGPVQGELFHTHEANAGVASGTLSDPLYFILVAGRDAQSMREMPLAVSVLADRDRWVQRDYEKVVRMLEKGKAHSDAIEAQLLAAKLALAEKDKETARRGRWAWWLKLPLIRLGLLK